MYANKLTLAKIFGISPPTVYPVSYTHLCEKSISKVVSVRSVEGRLAAGVV